MHGAGRGRPPRAWGSAPPQRTPVSVYWANIGCVAAFTKPGESLRMNRRVWVYLAIAMGAMAFAAQPKRPVTMPKEGVKTPGVLIPFAGLKAEAEFPKAPAWVAFTD